MRGGGRGVQRKMKNLVVGLEEIFPWFQNISHGIKKIPTVPKYFPQHKKMKNLVVGVL